MIRTVEILFALALSTSISLVRHKTTLFMIMTTMLLSGVALVMSTVDIGIRFRLFENVLLSIQVILLHGFAWMYTYEVIKKEQAACLYMVPLSTGIRRSEYITGRFLGIVFVIGAGFVFLLLLDAFLIFAVERTVLTLFFIQLFLYAVSAILVASITLLLSMMVAPVNAVMYSIFIWIIGNSLDELLIYSTEHPSVLSSVSQGLYYAFPNYSFFDYASQVVNRLEMVSADIFFAIGYGIIYSIVLLLITVFIYAKKVLACSE